jgi:hypothetical protein
LISILVACIFISLFLVVSFRNFFIQLISVKLLVDSLVFALASIRGPDQSPYIPQASALLVSGLGTVLFFGLMAAGIQMFSKSRTLDLEAENE